MADTSDRPPEEPASPCAAKAFARRMHPMAVRGSREAGARRARLDRKSRLAATTRRDGRPLDREVPQDRHRRAARDVGRDHVGRRDADAYVAALTERLPQRRLGTVEEAGAAIVFLMSNGAMDGETLHVDGGARLV
jgi:hypothetical protein